MLKSFLMVFGLVLFVNLDDTMSCSAAKKKKKRHAHQRGDQNKAAHLSKFVSKLENMLDLNSTEGGWVLREERTCGMSHQIFELFTCRKPPPCN